MLSGKPSKKVPKSAYYLLPLFGVWTLANIYIGLQFKYGGSLLPQKTKFLIDEGGNTGKEKST